MKKYLDKTNNSGVESFEITSNSIKVKFKYSDEIYIYSYESAGKIHVENMKNLAVEGIGLSTYISKYASEKFEK